MHHKASSFADCFLHPRFRYFRLILFSGIAVVVFLSLWSLSGHPLTNNYILSDLEIDNLYRACHLRGHRESREPNLGIFVPFDSSQIELIKMKLALFLENDYCPCNITTPEPETAQTEIIFFFLGDPLKHSNLFVQLLGSLEKLGTRKGKRVVLKSVRSCFHRILFKSLRDLDLPLEITIADLFYGVIESDLLKAYTHIIWMDASVSPLRKNWVTALHNVLHSEPFWILGAMTSSRRLDHYERGQYHMHMNAVYRVDDVCFVGFLKRVRSDYRGTTPDLAIHLYRTDYANFREAQHTQHLFRYSRMFISLDLPMTVRPQVNRDDWPGTYFVIQDRHYERFGKKAMDKEQPADVDNGDFEEGKNEDGNVVENEVKKEEKMSN